MKNLFYLAVFVLFTASCTKDEPEPYVNPVSTIAKEFTVQPNEWVVNGQQGTSNYSFVSLKKWDAITQDVFDNYSILVFIQQNDVSYNLPMIFTYGTFETIINYGARVGELFLIIADTDLLSQPLPTPINFKAYIIKTALIDPGKKYTEEEIKALTVR
jgi:hypothetical protein